MRPFLLIAAAVAVLSAAACSPSSASTPPAPQAPAPAPAGRRLLFFMNPDGQPCQVQEQILRGMPDLAGRAEVVRVLTTEPAHMAVFQGYGVRALPTLVLVDGGGRELRRATPGVQSDAAVRALLE